MERRQFLVRSAAAVSALGAAALGAACTSQDTPAGGRPAQDASPAAPDRIGSDGGERFRLQSPGKDWSYRETGFDTGARCERFELRKGDQWPEDVDRFDDGRQRVTLRGETRWPHDEDVWFAYSLRWSGSMPRTWSNLTELHSGLEEDETPGKPPPFSISISDGRFSLNTRADPRARTTSKVDTVQRYSGQLFARDTWQHVVMRIRLDPRGGGRLTFWLNGRRRSDSEDIRIGYNDDQGPYFKYGLYRGPSTLTTVAEFANVEIGTTSLRDRIAHPEPLPG